MYMVICHKISSACTIANLLCTVSCVLALKLSLLLEKTETSIFEEKLTSSVSHPTTHLLPCDLCDVLPEWSLTGSSISYLLDEKLSESVFMNSVCWESCSRDCNWTLHCILYLHANLFSDQSLMVHGLYPCPRPPICSPIWNSRKLCNAKPFLLEHQPSFS